MVTVNSTIYDIANSTHGQGIQHRTPNEAIRLHNIMFDVATSLNKFLVRAMIVVKRVVSPFNRKLHIIREMILFAGVYVVYIVRTITINTNTLINFIIRCDFQGKAGYVG